MFKCYLLLNCEESFRVKVIAINSFTCFLPSLKLQMLFYVLNVGYNWSFIVLL